MFVELLNEQTALLHCYKKGVAILFLWILRPNFNPQIDKQIDANTNCSDRSFE